MVDVAHILTTQALTAGDLKLARTAAEIAVLAAPYEESTRLNLAKVTADEGHQHQAEQMLRDEVFTRSDDGEPPAELTARTQEILASWRAHQAR